MRHVSDSTYNRTLYVNKYSMCSLVAEIILSSQIFHCVNIYHVFKSTHPWTFKLFTSFKLSQVSICEWLCVACNFIFLGYIWRRRIAGPWGSPKVSFTSWETAGLFQKKKKKQNTLSYFIIEFQNCSHFFVLGKTLRFSIKQWSILALCITKHLFCVSVMVLHNLPNSFSEDMSYCQRLLVFSINISNVILKYQKYFFLLFHSLTSLFWGRRFYFFIVFRPCPCTKIAFPLEREKSSMFRTKFIVTQIRWF